MLATHETLKAEYDRWQHELESNILPFWTRALDQENGGVFTCFTNDGTTLLATDKYTWSQGRFLWNWSRNAELARKGLISSDAEDFLIHARKTAQFLEANVFLENGNCAFVLSKEGEKKEPVAGQGYDTSFYADCFVVIGFSEYARVSGEAHYFDLAYKLYQRILNRLAEGSVRSDPYPAPQGFVPYAYDMIVLGVATGLTRAGRELNAAATDILAADTAAKLESILTSFHDQADMRPLEMKATGDADGTTLLERHITPGHTLECMWFCQHAAEELGTVSKWQDAINRASRFAYDRGWDKTHGGLFRYTDFTAEHDEPQGTIRGDDPYEQLIRDTWSAKIWWVHSEALYTTLLLALRTDDTAFFEDYKAVRDYTMKVFPNPNKDIGEWVQIQTREGQPMNKVVALPVKDPFHIMRNLQLMLELLDSAVKASEAGSNA
ncbi:AGE family epimerase/isomerase [Pseudovibrio flavus]|uniref:AGE family epimerase/isomerase n=1 Tax=Pseudovibrio flavus TaxID=2529854 RepID=UPI00211C11D6|nr:AGE family epimerase/isomerase [Pseudovibrio flavus]